MLTEQKCAKRSSNRDVAAWTEAVAVANFASLSAAAKATYQALEPTDLLNKHAWLFRQHHVEESADEFHDDDLDYTKREERVTKLRTDALRKVYAANGLAGIFELAERGQTGAQIGWLMAEELLAQKDSRISLRGLGAFIE